MIKSFFSPYLPQETNVVDIGVLNTLFLNISNYLPHLEPKNRSIQIVVISNFVVASNVGIKRFDCTCTFHYTLT